MSGSTSGSGVGSNVTSTGNMTVVVAAGPNIIQVGDFYQKASILHPIIVGSIAVLFLFACLRLGSNRSVAPITVFDWIINVALGSTLAGIVNGNSLVRGVEALLTMLLFQYITSFASSNLLGKIEFIFRSPPLVIAFRGKMLKKVMARHRISPSDVYSAMRQQGVLNINQVECGIIEANGAFSIFTTQQLENAEHEPTALQDVPAYCVLVEQYESEGCDKANSGAKASSNTGGETGSSSQRQDKEHEMSEQANDAAGDKC